MQAVGSYYGPKIGNHSLDLRFNPIRGPLELERDTSLSCPCCCDDPVFIEQEREMGVIGRLCLPRM